MPVDKRKDKVKDMVKDKKNYNKRLTAPVYGVPDDPSKIKFAKKPTK